MKEFFTKMGFSFNPQFTDEKGACLVLNYSIFVMLLSEEFFKSFTKKDIPNTEKTVEAILAVQAESFEDVETLAKKAFDAGAKETYRFDYGWMKNIAFADLDGHYWEIFFADMSKMPNE